MSITEMQERHRPLTAPSEPAADDFTSLVLPATDDFTSLVLPAKLEAAHRGQLRDVAWGLDKSLRECSEHLLHLHLLLRANFAAPIHSVSEPIAVDGHELGRTFEELAQLARALDSIILTSVTSPRRADGSQIEDASHGQTRVPRSDEESARDRT